MALLDPKPTYKPFAYPWAFEAWQLQQRLHWLPDEVPLADDVKDWQRTLTDGERNLLFVKGGVPGARDGYVLISK